jgi:hypothetical protein
MLQHLSRRNKLLIKNLKDKKKYSLCGKILFTLGNSGYKKIKIKYALKNNIKFL